MLVPFSFDAALPSLNLSEEEFSEKISLFLYSPKGAQYRDQFKFNGTLACKDPAPPILVRLVSLNVLNVEEERGV